MHTRSFYRLAMALAAFTLLFIGAPQRARADAALKVTLTDQSWWHTATTTWDEDPNGLGMIVWFKDPDPAKQFSKHVCYPEDCSEIDYVVTGLFPIYSPGRLQGTYTVRDPNQDDVCHDAPSSTSLLLIGRALEAWIYRSADLQQGISNALSMPETDENGNEIWYVRNIANALLQQPRIAKGSLEYVSAGSGDYTGPANHITVRGPVVVERDPTTLALLDAPVPGSVKVSETWSTSPQAALQYWYDVVVPEFYGVQCNRKVPNPSDSAVIHAQSFDEKVSIVLRLSK